MSEVIVLLYQKAMIWKGHRKKTLGIWPSFCYWGVGGNVYSRIIYLYHYLSQHRLGVVWYYNATPSPQFGEKGNINSYPPYKGRGVKRL